MATISTVKSLLLNARLLYLVKYQEVLRHLNAPDADLEKLNESFHTLFTHWSNPKLWTGNISWIPGKTAALILKVDEVDPRQCQAFKTAARALLKHFKEELLKETLTSLSSTDTSTWNLRMLNALRKTLQQEDGRVAFFNSQGHDLGNHSDFQNWKKHQDALVATYRDLLINNAVEATESEVNNIKKRGTRIEEETVLAEFFNKYQKLSAYLNKQVTGVSVIPHFAARPSEENQKSINALSLVLIKMDQEIGRLAKDGKDFTKDADFDSLSNDQLTLQNSFRKALFCNTISASASDTADIDKIATSLASVDDLAGIKTEYQALNTLMRTRISASS